MRNVKISFFIWKGLIILSQALLESIVAIARQAGECILEYYGDDEAMAMERKADDSPVTQADMAANRYIVEALQQLTSTIPIVSEEGGTHEFHVPMLAEQFWLVDPLDGTKSFVRKEGEFTVNIALIEKQSPVLGVVYLPVKRCMYVGDVLSGSALKSIDDAPLSPIRTREVPAAGMDIFQSKSHGIAETEAFLGGVKVNRAMSAASSLKFCKVAEGSADLYPRFGTTMEWDTAAGHAVLLAAGGRMETPDGEPFLYAKPDFRNGYFIAYGR